MSDLILTTDSSLIVGINKDATSDHSPSPDWFQVKHLQYPSDVMIFEVDEIAVVQVVGTIKRSGTLVFNNTTSGDGTILIVEMAGTGKLVIDALTSASSAINIGAPNLGDLVMISGGSMRAILDSDNDSGTLAFTVRNSSGAMRAELNKDGELFLDSATGTSAMVIHALTGSDTQLVIGNHSSAAHGGKLVLKADTTAGTPGTLVLQSGDTGDNLNYLWLGSDGYLWINTAEPTTTDSGTKVCDQHA
ncbi:MAG: hypothetical protein EXR69_10180 [Myxococcales bacterium]|nr:hypothetical protein [Myxococcales bacterium]